MHEPEIIVPLDLIKPDVQLSGQDGNAFIVIGVMTKALKSVGNSDSIVEDYEKQATSDSYNHLLKVSMSFANVN